MLLPIANVLTAEQVAHCRSRLGGADWADGRITAGHQSAKAKDNAQLPEDSPVARELGALVLEALSRNSTFFSAALPKRVYPPLFNRYAGGQSFDYHVDNAIRYDRSGGRADDRVEQPPAAAGAIGQLGGESGVAAGDSAFGQQRRQRQVGVGIALGNRLQHIECGAASRVQGLAAGFAWAVLGTLWPTLAALRSGHDARTSASSRAPRAQSAASMSFFPGGWI